MSSIAERLAKRQAELQQHKTQQPPETPKVDEPKPVKKQGANGGIFSKVKDMSTPGKVNPKEWSDAELSKIPIYTVTQVTAHEAVLLGQQMKRLLLGTSATKELVDIALFLAVSLRDPSDLSKYLLTPPTENFGKRTAITKPTPVEIQEKRTADAGPSQPPTAGLTAGERLRQLREAKEAGNIINEGKVPQGPQVVDGSSVEEQAAVYCFVAAFLMRTHSRQTESFLASLDSMIERCGGWYEKADVLLKNLSIDAALVNSFKMLLSRREEIISTWVMWVAYNENEADMTKNNRGMMSYLAGQIYQYTGLHAAVQILAIQQVTHVPMDQLLGELNHRSTRQPLQAFYRMLQYHELVKEHPGRKTYFRYARVWDTGYFHELQSKVCPDLVFLAATILKQVSPTGAKSDPTKIYAIQDLGDAKKAFLTEVAGRISSWLVRADDDNEETGASWS